MYHLLRKQLLSIRSPKEGTPLCRSLLDNNSEQLRVITWKYACFYRNLRSGVREEAISPKNLLCEEGQVGEHKANRSLMSLFSASCSVLSHPSCSGLWNPRWKEHIWSLMIFCLDSAVISPFLEQFPFLPFFPLLIKYIFLSVHNCGVNHVYRIPIK